MKKTDFRDEVVEAVARTAGVPAADVAAQLTTPPRPEMGDAAFPCYLLAKAQKKAPPAIAQELAAKLAGMLKLCEAVEATGPYVNFRFRKKELAEAVLREAITRGARYGSSSEGAGQVIAIDYSSPNVAKPFHVGHIRSTIIGGALYRLFETLGYRSVGINHLGDWGTQFGMVIVGLKRWGSSADLSSILALNGHYVRANQEAERDPKVRDEAREWFRKQEAGDPEAMGLWTRIRETTLEYLKGVYGRLGSKFDAYTGESFFNDKMEAVVVEAKRKGITSMSQGALVVDLASKKIATPALLKKSDGATLYMTRDVAAAEYRHATYGFHKLLYVVGTGQTLHFQQLFAVLDLLGHAWSKDCVHVAFGLVKGMSTRKGEVVYLEELLDEAKARALKAMRETIEKRPEIEDEESVAAAVGTAAIFFADLAKSRIKDYEFDMGRAISFEGDTGPYLMNAHARIAGIIRKCGVELDPSADVAPLVEPEAHRLVGLIARYGDVLCEAARAYEPSVLAQYLLDLAHALHSSYNVLRVKDEAPPVAKARLLLFAAVKQVLAGGLEILGIRALEKM